MTEMTLSHRLDESLAINSPWMLPNTPNICTQRWITYGCAILFSSAGLKNLNLITKQ